LYLFVDGHISRAVVLGLLTIFTMFNNKEKTVTGLVIHLKKKVMMMLWKEF